MCVCYVSINVYMNVCLCACKGMKLYISVYVNVCVCLCTHKYICEDLYE